MRIVASPRVVASVVACLLTLVVAMPAFALDFPARPGARVNDYARKLSTEDLIALESLLASYEQGTTRQIAIAVFPALAGESLEDLSMRIAERWKIGGKQSSDGVLITVFVDEHKMRIEVGYGLEGQLTDAECNRLLRDVMAPRFRSGDFAGGLRDTVEAIHTKVTGEKTLPAEAPPPPPPPPSPSPSPPPKRPPIALPHIHDHAGVLEGAAPELSALLSTLREESEIDYHLVIFDTKNAAGAAAEEEPLKVCGKLKKKTRCVVFLSFLDSTLGIYVTPALEVDNDEVIPTVIRAKIFPFYQDGNVPLGLRSGVFAMDTILTDHNHPEIPLPIAAAPAATAAPLIDSSDRDVEWSSPAHPEPFVPVLAVSIVFLLGASPSIALLIRLARRKGPGAMTIRIAVVVAAAAIALSSIWLRTETPNLLDARLQTVRDFVGAEIIDPIGHWPLVLVPLLVWAYATVGVAVAVLGLIVSGGGLIVVAIIFFLGTSIRGNILEPGKRRGTLLAIATGVLIAGAAAGSRGVSGSGLVNLIALGVALGFGVIGLISDEDFIALVTQFNGRGGKSSSSSSFGSSSSWSSSSRSSSSSSSSFSGGGGSFGGGGSSGSW